MKKYVMLIAFTCVFVLGISFIGNTLKNSVAEVTAVMVSPITAESAVICSGHVERVSTQNVFASSPSLVKQLYVKEGDVVEKGQLLMELVPNSTGSLPESLQTYAELFNAYQQINSTGNAEPQKLLAPISGTVTSLSITSEGSVSISKPAAVISGNDGLQVRLNVNETQISQIKLGQKVVITGSGFQSSTYTGFVKCISNEAEQNVSTAGTETVVEVVVTVDNPGEDIKPGYTAKVKIITAQSDNVIVVPYEAVRADEDGGEYVFKIEGNRAIKAPIVTEQEFENGFSIKSGLSTNDKIVQNPDNVSDGSRVILKKESMVDSND